MEVRSDQGPPSSEVNQSSFHYPRTKFARVILVSIVTVASLFVTIFAGAAAYRLVKDDKWGDVLLQHYAALIAFPVLMGGCLFVVALLEVTIGPIEFECLGFKFRGSSGPVVLWVFSVLGMVFALRLLWNLK